MAGYSQQFIDEVTELYGGYQPLMDALHSGNPFLGRYLDDGSPSGIPYTQILESTSLEELKSEADIIRRKRKVYSDFMSGKCFDDINERRARMCPRSYAQNANDNEALDAFPCYGVFCIPECTKFKTGECWEIFDKLGLKMK